MFFKIFVQGTHGYDQEAIPIPLGAGPSYQERTHRPISHLSIFTVKGKISKSYGLECVAAIRLLPNNVSLRFIFKGRISDDFSEEASNADRTVHCFHI
jgi:hypothetical protein